ncbi:MAG: amidohydrolase [Acidobacteriota bacterium]|nr:MAG: amidohydrolase [Acidobacteriota bacterium]
MPAKTKRYPTPIRKQLFPSTLLLRSEWDSLWEVENAQPSRPFFQFLLLVGFLVLIGCSGAPSNGDVADLVLRDGVVYTMDGNRSVAESIAVSAGRILAVGPTSGIENLIGPETRIIDLKGRMVLPGFQDSHLHPVTGGIELGQCNLNGLQSGEEVLSTVRAFAEKHPDAEWIVGGGWDLPLFPKANPHRTALDRIVSDRPVYLTAADGHSAWVNSRALEMADITRRTADPLNGRIERDPDGIPSGTLRESAMDLVSKHLPETTEEDRIEGLRKTLRMAARFGITSMIEASADEDLLQAYRLLDERGELTARVTVSQYVDPEGTPGQLDRLIERAERFTGGRFEAHSAKFFVDGVIESHTAALLAPYLDRPGDAGELIWQPEKLRLAASELNQAGIQLHFHAIGDRAIRATLDLLQDIQQREGGLRKRPHLAHIELFDPADIPRFAQIGAVANFQPLWAYADSYITDLTEPILGPERSRWLYPIRSLFESEALVVSGSDWSVSSMNPLDAIQVAVTRQPLDGSTPVWIPEEKVSLDEMLASYTINGALLLGKEAEHGSLEVGKRADLLVLDHDMRSVAPAEIHRVQVDLTLLEGEVIWQR